MRRLTFGAKTRHVRVYLCEIPTYRASKPISRRLRVCGGGIPWTPYSVRSHTQNADGYVLPGAVLGAQPSYLVHWRPPFTARPGRKSRP
jgi:hypothetical protein